MIQLLYTGVIREGLPQTNPLKSIGGYVSSSVIPNSSLDNIFTGVSYFSLVNNKATFEVSGIAFKNVSGSILTDVTFWFEVPEDSLYTYRISFVSLAEDECGSYMELLSNRSSLPYIGEFLQADIDNKRNIGNLESNQKIGIWIKREIKEIDIAKLVDCDLLYRDYLEGKSLALKKEEVILNIQFNE
jgi:hypothetical protein